MGQKTLFLTGITGTLGKELIKELLTSTEDHLFVLIRRKQRHSHWDRVRKILIPFGLEHHLGVRVHAVEGDVTEPFLGIADYDLEIIRKRVDTFYHIAALTNLNGSREDCERINVGGTEHALTLARTLRKNGKLERFFYFSTAYSPGSKQTYCSVEDGLPEKPAPANFYESSKYAAETKVREAMRDGLPVTIFRPSIVVGHSETGEVSEFNVIYPFIRLFVHGMLKILPSRSDNTFNIVPIDFVVKAALAIAAQKDSVGKGYHLVSDNPPTIGMLMELRAQHYPEIPEVKMIDPDDFKLESLDPAEQFVFAMLEPYLGYLNDALTFDTTNTRKALEGTGISFPETGKEFLDSLLRYAVDQGYLVLN